jgi:hypothetical protein
VALVVAGLAGTGIATDTLPGPLRTAAFHLGFPVSSPVLVATRADMANLRQALTSHNSKEVRDAALVLRHNLAAVGPDDLKGVQPAAEELLTEAADFLATEGAGQNGGTTETSAPEEPSSSATGTSTATSTQAQNIPLGTAEPTTTTTETSTPEPSASSDTSNPASTSTSGLAASSG